MKTILAFNLDAGYDEDPETGSLELCTNDPEEYFEAFEPNDWEHWYNKTLRVSAFKLYNVQTETWLEIVNNTPKAEIQAFCLAPF